MKCKNRSLEKIYGEAITTRVDEVGFKVANEVGTMYS